jgi:hypothetical protein
MRAGPRQDNPNEPADAIDRAIDGTLESALHAHAVDLRERVLARLDEPVRPSPAWWQPLARPALLPVAGAVLLAIGVTITWRHVDDKLARAGAPRSAATAAARRTPAAPALPKVAPARQFVALPATEKTAAQPPVASAVLAAARSARQRRASAADTRVAAASFLEMDAMSAPAHGAVESASKGDDAGPSLPGAPAGDLGDPIKPMPPIRPIVIQPISAAPILDAPPVSTLAQPVSTLSTGEFSRDPSGPGKSGGVRP